MDSTHNNVISDTLEQPNVNSLLKVIKRDGAPVEFDANKIEIAMTKAFMATDEYHQISHNVLKSKVLELTKQVVDIVFRRYSTIGAVTIEEIQDQVELALMRSGEQKIARRYVIYREKRAEARRLLKKNKQYRSVKIKGRDGKLKLLPEKKFMARILSACEGLDYVEGHLIFSEAVKNLFDGIDESQLSTSLIMASRTMIEFEPNYSYVTARFLLEDLTQSALSLLKIKKDVSSVSYYQKAFIEGLKLGVSMNLINPELLKFDLNKLSNALQPSRDKQFNFLGLQTLYDRYFLHKKQVRYELPQAFFMRVAMGLALNEKDRDEKAIEFYLLLSSFNFMSSTPTLFNSGCVHSQLSSCYLSTVPDDLNDIFNSIHDNAMLSKWAGGLGNDWTPVRALGSEIKGTNGLSQGVVPFLKVANDTAVAVNQGGKRKGAVCAYLESWHLDIEEFLDLRKNTGDERRRTHDMNTANWIPDLFMERVMQEKDWTLFSPSDTPDLHDLYGSAFKQRYEQYEAMVEEGKITLFRKVPAVTIWRKMLSMIFETGHPWITFKDPCNIRSPQKHAGVVHSSNLCTEITLNTSKDEIAVCNLGSINLSSHIIDGKLDKDKLRETTKTAIRMLDNVIDINFYVVGTAKNSNMKHRPIGLGLMGFQDALYKMGISYASAQAVEFADESMELISYYAIEASSDLALERGVYQSYDGSLWSQGILPIDSIKLLKEQRQSEHCIMDETQKLDWSHIRKKIKKQGMRNSNVLAIAPTATISNIVSVSQSIEPTYQNLFVKSNLSGEFTIINPFLVDALKKEGIWDAAMANDLKYYDGSVQPIERIPEYIKKLFLTVFEVEPKWLIESASRRQKWIDQSQSLNIYMAAPSGKKIDNTYRMSWVLGLKTTYYLRSIGATMVEKSTIREGALNKVSANTSAVVGRGNLSEQARACAIDDPGCEACQ